MSKTIKEISEESGISDATIQNHIYKGLIQAKKKNGRWCIPIQEYERVIASYEARGFVLPIAYEGWRTVKEMSEELEKNPSSIIRYLQKGYLKGEQVSGLPGRGAQWIIEPNAYLEFTTRYKEAHAHLENWSTVNEYASIIGLSKQWVRELIREGRIKADKITRKEAMIRTRDEHVYRIPPHEMQRACQVSNLIDIGEVVASIEIEGISFSKYYFLETVFPALNLGENEHPTRKARIPPEDITKIIDYIEKNSRTLQLHRFTQEREAFNKEVKEMTLDDQVLNFPPPDIKDPSTLDRERQLWLLVKKGNNKAFGHLIQSYATYTYSQARARGFYVDVESKVSRGIFGLWKAVMNATSLDLGIRVYAKEHIKGNIRQFLKEERRRK